MQEICLYIGGVRVLADSQGIRVESLKDATKHIYLDLDWIKLLAVQQDTVERFLDAVDLHLSSTLYLGYEPTDSVLEKGEIPEKPMVVLHLCKNGSWRFGFVDRPKRKMSRKRQWLQVDGQRFIELFYGALTYHLEKLNVDPQPLDMDRIFWVVVGQHGEDNLDYVVNSNSMGFEYSAGKKLVIERDEGDFWEEIADFSEILTDSDVGTSAKGFLPTKKLPSSTVNITKTDSENLSIELFEDGFLWETFSFPVESLQMFNLIKSKFWPKSGNSIITLSLVDEEEEEDEYDLPT